MSGSVNKAIGLGDLPSRISSKISDEGCWLWDGAVQSNGYGRCWSGTEVRYAHRVVYELSVGPIPEGMDLDHLCRNRRCVNPTHLEPVTRAENIRRGNISDVNTARAAAQTKCKRGHEFTDENTRRYNGRRHCRACARLRHHEKENNNA